MLSASGGESAEELSKWYREQLYQVYESQEKYKALVEMYYISMVACQEDSQVLQK